MGTFVNRLTLRLIKFTVLLSVLVLLAGPLATVEPDSQSESVTLTVNTVIDTTDGRCPPACSLRGAIAVANPGDIIDIPFGDYYLTQGQLVIDKDLTLDGAHSSRTIIQAAPSSGTTPFRVLKIASGHVAIEGVTIRDGQSRRGGGIFNDVGGTVTITKSAIIENSGIGNTGGGVGIYNAGVMTLIDSWVSNNRRRGAGGKGGGVYNSGEVTLINSHITDNTAKTLGGGVYNESGARFSIHDSGISGNKAPFGGGIYNLSGTVTVTSSSISDNTSDILGASILNGEQAVMELTDSTISGNTPRGGIVNLGTLTLTNSTVSNNTLDLVGGGAGGINNGGIMTLTNTTVSGNSGGGIYNGRFNTTTLTNSTVTDNTSQSAGGGIFNNSDAVVEIINTIVAGNEAPTGPDCAGSITSRGNNLLGDNSDCEFTAASGDLAGNSNSPIDPVIGQLQDNGGPTETHALLEGGPAIDAGEDTTAPETDQRGPSPGTSQ